MSRLRRRRLGRVALLAACGGALWLACGGPADTAPRARLVVLYAPCTVNKDYLSPYDASVRFTPYLESFARDAVVFPRHQTETGQSGVSYASLFSGAQADRHGIYRQPARLADEVYLIAEAFADDGYRTFYWAAHPAASPGLNYAQGIGKGNAIRGHLHAGDPRFQEVLDRLEADPDDRVFMVATSILTHSAYQIAHLEAFHDEHPDRAAGISKADAVRFAQLYREHHHALAWNFAVTVAELGLSRADVEKLVRAVELLYASNVGHLDRVFGETVAAIDARGLRDQSLVAFTADHGELLYRENSPFQWSHGMQLAPEVLNVPLLVRAPGLAGGRYAGVTRSIDVFPTLAALAGIPLRSSAGIQGVNLSAALRGREAAPRLVARSHTAVLNRTVFQQMYSSEWSGVWSLVRRFYPSVDVNWIWVSARDGDVVHKYQNLDGETWGNQVFDLSADPHETRNLYDPEDPEHRELAAELASYKAGLVRDYGRRREEEARRLLSEPGEAELLRGLGYVQ